MKDFDAIIVGAGIAGLGVAGILQSNGIKVLVLEKSKLPGGRAKTRQLPGGWKVDSGIHCVDLGEFSACAKLVHKLGADVTWSRPIKGAMIFDGQKWSPIMDYLDLSGKENEKLRVLEDRFSTMMEDEIDALDSISLSAFIRQNALSPKLAEYLRIIGMVQTTLTRANMISMGEFVSTYRESMKHRIQPGFLGNVRMPVGGIGMMTQALANAVASHGGIIQYSTSVEKLIVSKYKPFQVYTSKDTYSAASIVLALPIWQLVPILAAYDTSNLPTSWWQRIKRLVSKTSASMGFTVGTNEPLFTEPLYLCAWRIPDLKLPLQILGHTIFDETLAPPGHMLSFIGTPCGPAEAKDDTFRGNALRTLWETVKKMFPDIEQSLVWKVEGSYVGIDGLSRSPGLTGKNRPPLFLKEVPGIYFAGDCYTGRGIGMNAAANSAMLCAEKILSDLYH